MSSYSWVAFHRRCRERRIEATYTLVKVLGTPKEWLSAYYRGPRAVDTHDMTLMYWYICMEWWE